MSTTVSLLPKAADLALYAGDDARISLRVRHRNGDPTDLTGLVATAQLRASREDTTVLAEFTATIEDNVIRLHLPHDLAAGLSGWAVWDVQIEGADVTTLATGNVQIVNEVTR